MLRGGLRGVRVGGENVIWSTVGRLEMTLYGWQDVTIQERTNSNNVRTIKKKIKKQGEEEEIVYMCNVLLHTTVWMTFVKRTEFKSTVFSALEKKNSFPLLNVHLYWCDYNWMQSGSGIHCASPVSPSVPKAYQPQCRCRKYILLRWDSWASYQSFSMTPGPCMLYLGPYRKEFCPPNLCFCSHSTSFFLSTLQT